MLRQSKNPTCTKFHFAINKLIENEIQNQLLHYFYAGFFLLIKAHAGASEGAYTRYVTERATSATQSSGKKTSKKGL